MYGKLCMLTQFDIYGFPVRRWIPVSSICFLSAKWGENTILLRCVVIWSWQFSDAVNLFLFPHFFHVFDVRIKFFRGISQIFKFPVTIFRIERKSPFFCKYQHPWLNHDILECTLSNSLHMSGSFLISSACAWVGIILSINTDFFFVSFFQCTFEPC